jgi:hypothetical protein
MQALIQGEPYFINQFKFRHLWMIDIIGRTQKSMKEAFLNLERAAKKMNLQINQNKTKYKPVTKNELANGPVHIEIGSYKFETVCSFTYSGSEVNYKLY